MSRCSNNIEREFYIRLAIRDRLSFRELNRQIDASVYERTMIGHHKLSSLSPTMPIKANEVFRDHYVMEYITGQRIRYAVRSFAT